ncbi:short chain dehydrogenase reductase family [Fusarium albosuccineum]|uniref:Short chain dehydrogenase reductase family n=1 Tax=Fusarium albosuccineum TaxID=1237068 RepID=A0A8H4NUH6_9HYPO|nr:short chain dehydrogenase reductase family [Fusarium albosuccineum]
MDNLQGKVFAITGGASGIGLATAELLTQRGASVSLADVQEQQLLQVANRIRASGAPVLTCVVDVRKPEQVDGWIKETVSVFGQLHGVANMAGVSPRKKSADGIAGQDEEDWQMGDTDKWKFVLDINLTGLMHCLRSEMPHVAPGGSVVNASSVMGLQGRANSGAYAASKHGVIGLSRCVAKEAGPRGIRVNCIAPGFIETPMLTSSFGDKMDQLGNSVPLGRVRKPKDAAALIAFLLSDKSKYITATVLTVDGGWQG